MFCLFPRCCCLIHTYGLGGLNYVLLIQRKDLAERFLAPVLIIDTCIPICGAVFGVDYMRAIRFLLNTIAQWPNAALGIQSRLTRMLVAYRYALIGMAICYIFSNLMYIKKNIKTIPFIELGQSYANISMTLVYIQRLTLVLQQKYISVVKTFVLEFHLKYHENKNDFAAMEHRRIDKICKIAVVIILFQMFIGMFLYNLVPLYNNIRLGMFSDNRPPNRTFEHSIYYELPFDPYTDTTGYFIMFIHNWYPSYCVVSGIFYYDLLIFILIFHISGHLNILKLSLKHFPRPSRAEQSTREYNEEVFTRLKDIIIHYENIKMFTANFSKAFDISICAYLAFHQVIGCVLLLECSSMEPEALSRYGLLTLVMFQQLIQTSIIFEIVHSKSESIGDAVYALPWELMDVNNRKIVLLFLRNVQNPLAFKAGGMVPVGVVTMSQIIKTSFSYFLMLQTFAK